MKILLTIDPTIELRDFELNPIKIFNRELNNTILEFELKNNKIFDKQTESEWDFEGIAISGIYSGQKLQLIPATSAMWSSWLSANPDTGLYY